LADAELDALLSSLHSLFALLSPALSPFILNSRLKALMLRGGAHPQFGPDVQTTDKYIINVSAMEGKFYRSVRLSLAALRAHMHTRNARVTDVRLLLLCSLCALVRHKSACHPHTNAAKAALNMMTRTSAQDYARSRIFMTAVDTGWINDENPHDTAKRILRESNFQCPIDEEDAMARILDPLLSGVSTGINVFGKFFKDYHETEW
jgi:NAD(P)-dependent dehydrogenase (short-subunit alcohol dehydrogenase family)